MKADTKMSHLHRTISVCIETVYFVSACVDNDGPTCEKGRERNVVFCVSSRFLTTEVVWNLGLTQKIAKPAQEQRTSATTGGASSKPVTYSIHAQIGKYTGEWNFLFIYVLLTTGTLIM